MKRFAVRGYALLVAASVVAVALTATTSAAPGPKGKTPAGVHTKVDAAKTKLAPSLQQQLDSGSTASVGVFVTLKNGDVAAVKQLLSDDYTASDGGLALIVGKVGAQKLAKLASVNRAASPWTSRDPALPTARRCRCATAPVARRSSFDRELGLDVASARRLTATPTSPPLPRSTSRRTRPMAVRRRSGGRSRCVRSTINSSSSASTPS